MKHMGEVRFMISEAAKQVHVEAHVLRYWEEELGLKIGRTEMGHRYYTEDDIQLFCCIKKLKNEGMLLRDLKPLIPALTEARQRADAKKTVFADNAKPDAESDAKSAKKTDVAASDAKPGTKESDAKSAESKDSSTEPAAKITTDAKSDVKPAAKAAASDQVPAVASAEVLPVTQLEQVRGLIGDVLTEVVTTNNQTLEKNISKKVTNDVLREMDYLFQANERREEEHYRKLDMLIRQQQEARRESAKETPAARLKKILT